MKKLILTLCIALGMSLTFRAQSLNPSVINSGAKQERNLPPGERAKQEANKVAVELELNEEQKLKWQNAALERTMANAPLREKLKGSTTPGERKELHSQMNSNKTKFNSTVTALLSSEQKIKFEAWKKKKQEHKTKRGISHHNNSPE